MEGSWQYKYKINDSQGNRTEKTRRRNNKKESRDKNKKVEK
jgi:hypothetical protein